MPIWLKEKLFLKKNIQKELSKLGDVEIKYLPPLLFNEHHQSHAASAFFPSPFEKAAVLCLDGVGEWATTSCWTGEENHLKPIWEIQFPHSIGLLYSAFTYYLGFKVNSGEYKVMGLAPYGEPKYTELILDHLIDLKKDGSFKLNMKYFDFPTGLKMINNNFEKLFGEKTRAPESELTQFHKDVAHSIQDITEEIVRRLAMSIRKETGQHNLCLAGGVALNCVANGLLLKEKIFDNIFIQPAAGDGGGALGAAYSVWHEYLKNRKPQALQDDLMKGSYLGPKYSQEEIKKILESFNAKYITFNNQEELFAKIVDLIIEGKVIGLFQGRMEFGPRALGSRSIIGDPRDDQMQSTMNLKIKFRESFRPFAPAILAQRVSDYFSINTQSPYMLLVADVLDKHINEKSKIPAVTHVDNSARIQTVHEKTNPFFHKLLSHFEMKTGCPLLINTSFNVRGEPIVNTPEDAYLCFMRTSMDCLILENMLLMKEEQFPLIGDSNWKKNYELD